MTRFALAAVGLAAAVIGGTAQPPFNDPEPETGPLRAFYSRSGGTKSRALKQEGGNEETEAALAKGLAWLARQQKPGGRWEFPDKDGADAIAATGLTLLPYLGAGQNPRNGGKYAKTISDALAFLTGRFDEKTGTFGHDTSPTAHALATAAVCEAYGLTRDAKLLPVAKAAVGHLTKLQRPDGGWAEEAGKDSTMTGTGWAVLALRANRMAGLEHTDDAVRKLVEFLNRRGAGSLKSVYGEPTANDGRPGTTQTAIGLTARYLFDGWGPNNAGMAEGTIGLFGAPKLGATAGVTRTDRSRAPKTREEAKADPTPPEPLRAFYATRMVFAFGGLEWQEWNEGPKDAAGMRAGGMRDWLTAAQGRIGTDAGSWAPPPGSPVERWGRVGATALAALTLEVYYRDPPLFRRIGD